MSSRLIRGAPPATPMNWRAKLERVAATPSPSPPSGESATSDAKLRQLEAEIESRCRAAYNQGRAEGESAAKQQAEAQFAEKARQFAQTAEALTGLRPRVRHEAEQELVALSLAISRRILHREITLDPEAILGLVKAALARMDARELHTIRVRPDVAPLLSQHLEKIGAPQRIQVIPDASLETGAVHLECANGTLDASLETQLAEIERGFADIAKRN